jgi:hypothetical protein
MNLGMCFNACVAMTMYSRPIGTDECRQVFQRLRDCVTTMMHARPVGTNEFRQAFQRLQRDGEMFASRRDG